MDHVGQKKTAFFEQISKILTYLSTKMHINPVIPGKLLFVSKKWPSP
jgi:hypothetical protein